MFLRSDGQPYAIILTSETAPVQFQKPTPDFNQQHVRWTREVSLGTTATAYHMIKRKRNKKNNQQLYHIISYHIISYHSLSFQIISSHHPPDPLIFPFAKTGHVGAPTSSDFEPGHRTRELITKYPGLVKDFSPISSPSSAFPK